MSAVRALQVVDPSGAVAAAVGVPIQAYLRSRKDAIRRIVEALTTDQVWPCIYVSACTVIVLQTHPIQGYLRSRK